MKYKNSSFSSSDLTNFWIIPVTPDEGTTEELEFLVDKGRLSKFCTTT